jgi:oxaloacetate decarboxylase alpha subunit
MAKVEFVDQTLRDGQQSLWGMQMQAGMALPVTPLIDRVGYAVVDFVGSSMMEVLVRNRQEDPWEGLDLIVASMPRSRIRGGVRNTGIISMSVTPHALMDLWVRLLCRHGVRSFWIYDVLHWNIDNTHRLAKVAKEFDTDVVAALMYTLSPVHTDEFYGEKAALLSASPDVDRLLIYDTAGVLTAARAKTLIPAVQRRCNGKPFEIHCHNVCGIAPLTYLAAIELGVTTIHTCSRPLANGPSLPSVEMMLRNVSLAGHETSLDAGLLEPIAEHFERVARSAGFSTGVPNEYDLMLFEHQIPGGMTGTLKNQLAQHGMADRLDEVLHEVAAVRRELGYPGMATPFSQLVGTLAVLNIVTGERYAVIPDEVVQYALGHYGKPVAPIDPDVLDRIMSAPRAKDLAAIAPAQPTLDEIRRGYGNVSDEELILRALIAEPFIDKMRAAGSVRRDYPLLGSPELERARLMMTASTARLLEIESGELTLSLRR